MKFPIPRPGHLLLFLSLSLGGLLAAAPARAQVNRVRVTLQPDCFRPTLDSACDPRKNDTRLDLGPQIAIWIESADGATFVDTLMVTNLTASLGIGNRPGHHTLPSGPKFPYGKRPMSLPVWAHRRGKLYNSVVMQDGVEKEYWLGFHESVSSPDPYFCRPMTLQEIDVDAVTCPTQRFNSVKGRFFDPALDLAPQHMEGSSPKPYVPPPKSYYPPRNDLRTFVPRDCDGAQKPDCPTASKSFADINDLDGVATATPPYGQPWTRSWRLPDDLPEGEYVLYVEVNKEFDQNASHAYPAFEDPQLAQWGVPTNFGQPSVVYRIPFALDREKVSQAAVSEIAGYGDWDGQSGTLHPGDATISRSPGSGEGRLLVISRTGSGGQMVMGRVHVETETGAGAPPPPDAGNAPGDAGSPPDGPPASGCGQPAPVFISIEPVAIEAESAELSFREPDGDLWQRTDEYELRVWNGRDQSQTAFEQGLALPRQQKVSPGSTIVIKVPNLRSESSFTVGVRPVGDCLEPQVGFASFDTVIREFTQLTGCFVATAAWGSALAPDVDVLRRVRDEARARNVFAAATADAYARSSPPVADLLARSPTARAVARALLAPVVEAVKAAAGKPPAQAAAKVPRDAR